LASVASGLQFSPASDTAKYSVADGSSLLSTVLPATTYESDTLGTNTNPQRDMVTLGLPVVSDNSAILSPAVIDTELLKSLPQTFKFAILTANVCATPFFCTVKLLDFPLPGAVLRCQ
jgi:hypothetical protein